MEWTIPLQNLDVSNIKISKPCYGSKLISPIQYSDGNVVLNNLAILLPVLPIRSYDAASGRLQISLQGNSVLGRLQQFQEMLINMVFLNQAAWFPGERVTEKEDIRHGFQPFVEHGLLNLYCPCSAPNEIHNYTGKGWARSTLHPSIFTVGRTIRLAIKFQGISFHQHPLSKTWTGKFRLQHRILAIMAN